MPTLASLRFHLTYANVTATLAVFIALGGTSVAAVSLKRNSVGTKQLKKGAVRNSDLARSSVTTTKVRNGSLLAADFKAGQVPAGARGAQGPSGPQGTPGAAGAPGISGYQVVSQVTSIPGMALGSTAADCPVGKTVIGGGFNVVTATATPGLVVLSSRPFGTREWVADVRNITAGAIDGTAFAVCGVVR